MATVLKTYNLDDRVKEYREFRVSKDKTDDTIFNEAHDLLLNTVGCKSLAQNGSLTDLNTHTMTTRCELFVDEMSWKDHWSPQFKSILYSLINEIESHMKDDILRNWNRQRFDTDPFLGKYSAVHLHDLHEEEHKEQTHQLQVAPPIYSEKYSEKQVLPATMINTRDCFAFDLAVVETVLPRQDKKSIVKRQFYFEESNLPENYKLFMTQTNVKIKVRGNKKLYPVGVTTYDHMFTHEEKQEMEKNIL